MPACLVAARLLCGAGTFDTLVRMSLDIRESAREGVTVLTMKGRLAVGESNALREKVNAVSAAGSHNIVLDLSQLDYIDSTGLGIMVICYTSLKKQDGAMKLVNLNKRNV